MRTMSVWALAAVVYLVALVGSAHAEKPTREISLGPGHSPLVAVDDNGTAHFVWRRGEGETAENVYCRIPAGSPACEAQQTSADGLGPGSAFDMLLRPAEGGGMDVIVLLNGNDATYSAVSSDGGNSWRVTQIAQRSSGHDAQLAADRNYVEILGRGGFFQAPLAGGVPPAGIALGDEFAGVQLGRDPRSGATIMTGITRSPGRPAGAIRFLSSTVAGPGNDESAWTPWRRYPAGVFTWVPSGAGGAHALIEPSRCTSGMQIARIDGTRIGPPSFVTGPRVVCERYFSVHPRALYSHATQDLGGRLQAAFVSLHAGCFGPVGSRCLIYKRSPQAGKPLGPGTVLRATRDFAYHARLAGGRDLGDAWLAWQTASGSFGSEVIVQRAFVSYEQEVGDGKVRLVAPSGCLPDRKRFQARVVADGVRIHRVTFRATARPRSKRYLKPRPRRDSSAPFRTRFRTPRRGGTHTERITAKIQLRKAGDPVVLHQDVTFGCGGL